MTAENGQSAEALPVRPEPESAAPCRPKGSALPAWPFVLYLVAWAGLAATTVLLLTNPQAASVPVEDPVYPTLLLVGLVLVACGPMLSLLVWLLARARALPECRGGLLTTSLVRGASAALVGAVAWWAALGWVDALRLGMIR